MEDKNQPLVSVIIACYNGEKYINQCLETLVNQTYKNIEVIICDDASKDGSLTLLNQWAAKDFRIVLLHNEKNLFAAETRNRCFKVAKGEYFCIQDIDDISKKERIEFLLEAIQKEKVDFVSSSMQCFDGTSDNLTGVLSPPKEYPTKRDFLRGISFCHPATMFTRDCIEAVSGYRVSLETRRCQDYDMFMRLYAKGFKGKNIRIPLYLYRREESTYKRGWTYSATVCEYKVRKYGFKLLELPVIPSFIHSLRPWASYLFYKVSNLFSIK